MSNKSTIMWVLPRTAGLFFLNPGLFFSTIVSPERVGECVNLRFRRSQLMEEAGSYKELYCVDVAIPLSLEYAYH